MNPEILTRTCAWAIPTFFLRWPLSLDAASYPWSCTRDGRLHLLSTCEGCRSCAQWAPRDAAAEPPTFSETQAIVHE
jgi:hypothetical protein